MRKFDDRFARQNRCEPPPEFPLASPYSGIVHHLSGPNIHALPRIRHKRSGPGVDAPPKGSQLSLSLCVWVFHPNTCRHVRLLGPCFKTGRLKPLCQHPKHGRGRNPAFQRAEFLNPNRCMHHWAITHPKMPHSQQLYPTVKIDADPLTRKYTQQKQGWFQINVTDFKRFPFSNFTYCLTLFPKFFSSFPHGTCSLSVSRQYLALDGIYHPFWAAFPNNSTLWEYTTKALVVHVKDRILTLCDAPFQETCTRSSTGNTSLDYNSVGQCQQILNLSFSRFTRSY